MSNLKTWIFLLTISCLFALGGCSKDNQDEVNALIENARTFMAQNKPETALVEYNNALQLDPDNDVALFEIAEVYIVLERLESAIRYYKLSASANPGKILPRLRLAQIYLQTDQVFEARAEVSKALEISPNSLEAYHILSGIQIQERDLNAAVDTLIKAAVINEQDVKTQISLAQLYLVQNRVPEALEIFSKAMVIDPSEREAYMGVIRIYARKRQFDKVESLFKEIINTPGNKSAKYTDFARFYEGRKKFELAEEKYQKAMVEEPDGVLPAIHLAEFYTRRNRMDPAVAVLKNLLIKKKSVALVKTALSQVYLHFGLIQRAQVLVDEVLAADSNYVEALFQKGKILVTRKDYKQALDYFDRVIAINRIDAEAYYYRGLCISEKGASDRPEQKIFRAAAGLLNEPDEFEKNQEKGNYLAAILVDPELVEPRIKLAEMYIEENNLVKAKEQLEEIFKRQAPNRKIMSLIAGIHILEGRPKEAETLLKIIIQQNPEYIPAYIRLGVLYRSGGYHRQALAYLKEAFKKNTKQIGLVGIMTDILIQEKKFDDALMLVKEYTSMDGGDYAAYYEYLLGEIVLKKGDADKAQIHFRKAVELKPDYIDPHMQIAVYYNSQRQFNRSLEHYMVVEKINPLFIPALMNIAVIFDREERLDQAEIYYRKVLEIDPQHIAAANNLSFILSEKPGTLEEAFRLAKIARNKRPKDPNVLDTMGWVFYQKGNFLSARSELEESLKINPDSALASFHLGMTLYRIKEYEKARAYLKTALELDDNFRGADLARKILN